MTTSTTIISSSEKPPRVAPVARVGGGTGVSPVSRIGEGESPWHPRQSGNGCGSGLHGD